MKTIIILEDGRVESKLMSFVVKKAGFNPICYYNIEDLLDNIEDLKNAAVLISDFDLPDGNALQVYSAMRKNNIKTPVILNSGNPSSLEIILSNGYGDMIVDNFNKSSSMSKINETLAKFK